MKVGDKLIALRFAGDSHSYKVFTMRESIMGVVILGDTAYMAHLCIYYSPLIELILEKSQCKKL